MSLHERLDSIERSTRNLWDASRAVVDRADPRFKSDMFKSPTFLERESMCSMPGILLPKGDPLLEVWANACATVRSGIFTLEPDLVIASGTSAKALLPMALGVRLGRIGGIPYRELNDEETYYLYKHRLGEAGDRSRDDDYILQSLPKMLEKRSGIKHISRILLMDESLIGGTKARISLSVLLRAGLDAHFGVIVGSIKGLAITSLAGSYDGNFYAFINNLASGISFVSGEHGERFKRVHPSHSTQVNHMEHLIGRSLHRLKRYAQV